MSRLEFDVIGFLNWCSLNGFSRETHDLYAKVLLHYARYFNKPFSDLLFNAEFEGLIKDLNLSEFGYINIPEVKPVIARLVVETYLAWGRWIEEDMFGPSM